MSRSRRGRADGIYSVTKTSVVVETTGDVETFVANSPANGQAITESLRKLVERAMPEAQEFVSHGAIGYSPTGSSFDRIVYILPSKGHVTLGFFFGAHLTDPERLLAGNGKRMRHVKIKTLAEAKNPALRRLIEAANADAKGSLASIHKKRIATRKPESSSSDKMRKRVFLSDPRRQSALGQWPTIFIRSRPKWHL